MTTTTPDSGTINTSPTVRKVTVPPIPVSGVIDPMAMIDGYKYGHRKQSPPGLTHVQSNWTPRGSRIQGVHEVVALGFQMYRQWKTEQMSRFFEAPLDYVLKRYARRTAGYLGPTNNVGTDHIAALHELGYEPLEYRVIPEGTRVPLRVPHVIVENTHKDFAWLVNYDESLFSSESWISPTSATQALRFRRMLEGWAYKTGAPIDFTAFQGHDFSFRGMEGLWGAILSAIGHSLIFSGTDTVPVLDAIEHYYGTHEGDVADLEALSMLTGCSVPATEHAIMCEGGKENELDTYSRLLDTYPDGYLSVVSDTWSIWHVLQHIVPALKDKILARNGKLVIRPDSGDPIKILCGDSDYPQGSPQYKGVVELLWDIFGGTATSQRHCVLDQHIGTIYGDAITYERADAICAALSAKGFASSNVVFGVGSFTYQYVTRDSLGWAFKQTWAKVHEENRALWKAPVTDSGEKFSAKGRLAVLNHPTTGKPMLVNDATPEQEAESIRTLTPVTWRDGQWQIRRTWDEIKTRVLAP